MPTKRLASVHRFTSDLSRVMGQSRLFRAMEFHSLDIVKHEDDFIGDTLNTFLYTVANGGGNLAVSPVITAGTVNGIIDMVTGDANGSTASSEITLGLNWRGDRGCVMVALVSINAISAGKVEIGWTDALADPGAINSKSGNTFRAADSALWVWDTADNANWEGRANNNTDTSPMAALIPSNAIPPVAGTFEWLMVELIPADSGDNTCAVEFSRFTLAGERTFREIGGGQEVDSTPESSDATLKGPNSNVLLTPWIYAEGKDATGITVSIDYFGCWQMRTTTRTT